MEMLYPDEAPMTERRSSIDQFAKFLAVRKKGGWAPIVFDQIDGIGECSGIKSHPVAISFDPKEIGYVYPEGQCTYASDKWITVPEVGVEERLLPECMGGHGEFYQTFVRANAFVNFGDDTSLGVHQTKTLRVGLSYCRATETLPAVD